VRQWDEIFNKQSLVTSRQSEAEDERHEHHERHEHVEKSYVHALSR
jgi:hypothetical protein